MKRWIQIAALTLLWMPQQAVASSYAGLGDACDMVYYHPQGVYREKSCNTAECKSRKCSPNHVQDSTGQQYYLTCVVAENDPGLLPANGMVNIEGTCEKTKCVGSNDVEEIENGNEPNGLGNHRVTICHRTCDETNPWIRLTIDKHAWDTRHDVPNMCHGSGESETFRSGLASGTKVSDCPGANETNFDSSPWGQVEDYIIKDHGLRSDMMDAYNEGKADESVHKTEASYWRYWEQACPYTRMNANGLFSCCGLYPGDCCGPTNEGYEADELPDTTAPTKTPTRAPTGTPTRSPLADGETYAPTGTCDPDPQDYFAQDVYLTFMGSASYRDDTVTQILSKAGTTKQLVAAELVYQYNKLGGNGKCVYLNRRLDNVTLHAETYVYAINKDYDLVGKRIRATVHGYCNGCTNNIFFPAAMCDEQTDTNCGDCIALSGTTPGKKVQIAGKHLYHEVNTALSLLGTEAELFRIEGDVSLTETTCGSGEKKYLEATGEAVCL